MKDIAIYGSGGFGREVVTLIQHINQNSFEYNLIGYFDDGHKKGEIINGLPVLGSMIDLNSWAKPIAIAIAVAEPNTKKRIVENIKNSNVSFPTLIHPSVIIGDHNYVTIGDGCIICAGSIITTNIIIKDFVIINLLCTVGHDAVIGEYCSFMPSVNISGEDIIENLVYIGTGAKVINQVKIGENTIIGAGAVVARDLPNKCTAVGVPAKVIKTRD